MQIRGGLCYALLSATESRSGLRQGRPALLDLLIEFGRVQLSQQLALPDVVADVYVTLPQKSIRPSAQGCFRNRRNVPRKQQIDVGRRHLDLRHRNLRLALFLRYNAFGEFLIAVPAWKIADREEYR